MPSQVHANGQSGGIPTFGVTVPFITMLAPFIEKLRVFGVTVDNHLSFDERITGVVRACKLPHESSEAHPLGHRHRPGHGEHRRVRHRLRETGLLQLRI